MIIFIIILLILAIPFIAALFIERNYTIERETIIDKPRQEVFNYIKYLKNQEHYNKWVMTDLQAKRANHGTDGTVGFVTTWNSTNKNVGKGEQEIKKIQEGERIEHEMRFEKPFKGTSTAYLETSSPDGKKTIVKWGFCGDRTYMMRVMHFILNIKKMLGNDIQTSLNNLKLVLEH